MMMDFLTVLCILFYDFFYDFFLECLRLQEEGDLNIWNYGKILVHKPRETGLIQAL